MSDVPDWIIKHAQAARDLHGLGGAEWHFFIEMNDRPGGHDEFDGVCSPDANYQNANIEIKRSIPDNERGREVIYHEVAHVAHADIDQVVERIWKALPKKERKLYEALYREAVERFITRSTRALLAAIRPQEVNDESE